MVNAKIITKEDAVKMGLAADSSGHVNRRGGKYAFAVVGKSGAVINGVKQKDEILEVFRMNIKTGEKELLFETEEYQKTKKKLNINQTSTTRLEA